ncbi:hypothetical protein Tco_0614104 [Tanacetum coccineum]
MEMDELISHVSEKTYAYGVIRAENQNLLFTISELKTRLANVEKGMNDASSVRRPMNRDSHVKNSVLANSKKPAKKVAVYVRKNNKQITHLKMLSQTKENVNMIDVANASKAKIFHKTRFSKESTLSKSLDTTYVVSKPKIDVVVQIVLWIVDSGCSKHMTGDRSLLKNFIEKFMGTVRFGNDNFAAITGYELAFRSKTCYVRNLEGDDLLTGGRESNLYTISIFDMAASSPVCLMSKATSTKS